MSSPREAEESCSRLSPHIAFGTISIREIYQNLSLLSSITFKRSLFVQEKTYWHCHFIQKLETEPELEFNPCIECDNLRESRIKNLLIDGLMVKQDSLWMLVCFILEKRVGSILE